MCINLILTQETCGFAQGGSKKAIRYISGMPRAAILEPVQRRPERGWPPPLVQAENLAKSPANASYEKSTTSTNFQSLPRKFNNLAESRWQSVKSGKVANGKVAK
jgi:hypothetical protein